MSASCIRIISLVFVLFYCNGLFAQPGITVLDSGHKASLRGLSVVNDNIVWASGSNGTVARSLNGGKSFEWMKVKGYETRDFRDVEAFSADTALIMAIAEPALILKTYDGGQNWKEVFRDTTKGMFLDAMDFEGKYGVVVGDPINNYAFLAYTDDFGETWKPDWTYKNGHISHRGVKLEKDEAFFASSGTNVKVLWDSIVHVATIVLASGGSHSGLVVAGRYNAIPMLQGSTSQGANSIDVFDNNAVIVGGDFAHDADTTRNCVLVNLKNGDTHFAQTPPHGYRSCVTYLSKNKLIACGTSGVDISYNGGLNWQLISRQSFHVCQKAKKGSAVFLAGANGKIAVYR